MTFTRAVTLGGAVDIDTVGGAAGNILFSSTIDGTFGLTLESGSTITLNGNVGVTTPLGAILVDAATNVDVVGTVTAASLVQTAGTGTTTLRADVTTSAASGVNVTSNAIMLDGLNIVTTGGGVVDFNGPVTLTTGPTDIDAAGAVDFSGTIDGTFGLTLESDSTITLNGNVGATTPLGAILVDTATDVDVVGTLTAASLVQTAGTGTTTLRETVTTSAAAGLNVTSNAITLDGLNIVTTGGGAVDFNGQVTLTTGPTDIDAAGAVDFSGTIDGTFGLTLESDSTITLNGNVGATTPLGAILVDTATDVDVVGTVTAASLVQTAGTGTTTLRADVTTADNVSFATAVTLTEDVAIGTGAGAGNITFQGTLDGTADLGQSLTLTAGTGNIDFDAAVGATTDLGDVTIVSAGEVTADAAFNADTLTINADNSIALDAVTVVGALDINLDTGVDGSSTLTTGAVSAGTITVDGQGTNDTFTFNDTVTSTVGGIVMAGVNLVNFEAAVTSATVLTVTASGASGTIDGEGQTLTATNALTLTAPEDTGVVKAHKLVGSPIVVTAHTHQYDSEMDANGGNATFTGTVLIVTADGLLILDAGNVRFIGFDQMTVSGGDLNISQDVTGSIELPVASALTVAGDIILTTSSGDITLGSADTTGDVTLSAASGAIAGGAITSGGSVSGTSGGGTSLGAISAGGTTDLTSTGGDIVAGDIASTGDITIMASSDITTGSLDSSGNITTIANAVFTLDGDHVGSGSTQDVAIDVAKFFSTGNTSLLGNTLTLSGEFSVLNGLLGLDATNITFDSGFLIGAGTKIRTKAGGVEGANAQEGAEVVLSAPKAEEQVEEVDEDESDILAQLGIEVEETEATEPSNIVEAAASERAKLGGLPTPLEVASALKELDKVLSNQELLTGMADQVEEDDDPETKFKALRKTDKWLKGGQMFLRLAQALLLQKGKNPRVAGRLFLVKYCKPLRTAFPMTYQQNQKMAAE